MPTRRRRPVKTGDPRVDRALASLDAVLREILTGTPAPSEVPREAC